MPPPPPSPRPTPPDLRARLDRAAAMIDAGDMAGAKAALLRLSQQNPREADAASMLSYVLVQLGEHAPALYHARRALDLHPRDPNLLVNVANLLLAEGRPEDALALYERAGAADPAHVEARIGRGNALMQCRRPEEALAVTEEAMTIAPGHRKLRANRGAALMRLGRVREAVDEFSAGARAHPDDLTLATGTAAAMNYASGVAPAEVRAAHEHYARALARRFPPAPPRAPEDPDPDRRVRVGLLSSDLRRHSVAHFVEPLLASHDRGRIEFFGYHASLDDEVSERLRRHTSAWRRVEYLPVRLLAETIRRDRVDILIELNGHTAGHRLPVLNLRPAPIQATWLGYPNTTGLATVDYRLVDSLTDPPGEADARCVERLRRLDPCFVCYQPPRELPALPPAPAGRPVAFGSFSAHQKMDERTLALFAAVLRRVPAAGLVLKSEGLVTESLRRGMLERLAAAGVEGSRVELLPPAPGVAEHLGLYGRLDVSLDTFPYHGTTTTCESLMMGVPVVTLAGRVHASRVGASLLSAAGLPELVARDEEEFVSVAAGLAADAPRLAALRETLRARVLGSTLCDGAAFARRFEGAVREMWRERCRAARG